MAPKVKQNRVIEWGIFLQNKVLMKVPYLSNMFQKRNELA